MWVLLVLVGLGALALFLVPRLLTPVVDEPLTERVEEATAVEKLTQRDLFNSLRRYGIRPEGSFPSLDAFFATPVYFEIVGEDLPGDVLEEPSLVFYVSEDAHEDLPEVPLIRI